MIGPQSPFGSLPPIRYRQTHYAAFLSDLMSRLLSEVPMGPEWASSAVGGPVAVTPSAPAGSEPVAAVSLPDQPPLAHLQISDSGDWIVALAEAWAALAEIFTFYQERIINEAFVATATQPASLTHLYNSLGHEFPANTTATTIVGYQLSAATSGTDAMGRAQAAGTGAAADDRIRQLRQVTAAGPSTQPADLAGLLADYGATVGPGGVLGVAPAANPPGGQPGIQTVIPVAAQIKALPNPDSRPTTYVTVQPLAAQLGLSGLRAQPTVAPPPSVAAATTQLVLDGNKTGLAPGQPIVIQAADAATGGLRRWVRVLLSVEPNTRTATTLVRWSDPLGADSNEIPLSSGLKVQVFGFGAPVSLFGAMAPAWSALALTQKLAVPAVDGHVLPSAGGLLVSADGGLTWTSWGGLPATVSTTAILSVDDLVLVAAGDGGLYRSIGGGPFTAVSMGGARRFVYFVGGTRAHLLAGTARGGVYQSFDDGVTWSAVTGGPPSVATNQVITLHQIPAVAVRAALQTTAGVVVGTDQGTYLYDGTNWAPNGLTSPVYALLASGDTLLAATDHGVQSRLTAAGAVWSTYGTGLVDRIYALALGDALYAGTDTGVWRLPVPGGPWNRVNGNLGVALPPGVTVRALVIDGTVVLAGTTAGLYRSSDQGASWTRVDDLVLFDWTGSDLTAGPDPQVPPSLVQAFGDRGISIPAGTPLVSSAGGYRVEVGTAEYALTGGIGEWRVSLVSVLPQVNALAAGPMGLIAGGGALSTPADEWPGFNVAGSQLDLASTQRQVVAGALAVLSDQSDGSAGATVLDVDATEQVALHAFGRQATVTRLHFGQLLTAGRYGRRTATVWVPSRMLSVATPPAAPVSPLASIQIPLATPLPASPPSGRLAAVTGKPVGLAVAPLGGAYLVSGSTASAVGPPQADATAVAIDGAGRTYLGTGEGVYLVSSDGPPTLLTLGWPGLAAIQLAVTGAAASLLAGTAQGVYRLLGSGTDSSWVASGLSGDAIVALTADATGAVAATSSGAVFRLVGTTTGSSGSAPPAGSDGAPTWTALAPLAGVVAMTQSGGAIYAATAAGVWRWADGGDWQGLADGFVGAGATSLVTDRSGLVWAGSAAGLQSLRPGADRWYPEPSPRLAGPVQAITVGSDGAVTVATATGMVSRTASGHWEELAADAGVPVAALAAAADGSLWVASPAIVPFTPEPGHGVGGALRHQLIFAGLPIEGRDVQALDQGSLPPAVVDALAAAGQPVDPSMIRVRSLTAGSCWAASAGSTLVILAARSGAPTVSLQAWRNLATAYPTAAAPSDDEVQAWPVELNRALGTLRVRREALIHLPATSDAPDLAETAVVMSVNAPDPNAPGAGGTLALSAPLTRLYDASTVALNLNVVRAVQGQPVRRVLGSGDPNVAHQNFSVPTPVAALAGGGSSGVGGSLFVFVDGEAWTEVSSLLSAQGVDRSYKVRTKSDGTATVYFGDGVHGSRLPAGQNNVVAQYLEGGGPSGEVSPGQLIQPVTRPQLVTGVYNPLAGTLPAGASAGDAVMVAVRSLSRTVTLSDFEGAALAQPGVAAAAADLVASGLRRAAVVTVAATAGAPADVLEQVAAAVGSVSGLADTTWVLAAEMVPIALSLEVFAGDPTVIPKVSAAVAGLSPARPGDRLLASQVLAAAATVAGVDGVRIVGWHRDGHRTSTASSLRARRAGWLPASSRPHPAESLFVDGNAPRLSVVISQGVSA